MDLLLLILELLCNLSETVLITIPKILKPKVLTFKGGSHFKEEEQVFLAPHSIGIP